MQQTRGLTLFELLVALLVLSIGMATALVPLRQALAGAAVRAELRELLHSLKLARQTAVNMGRRTVLCGVDETLRCGGDWSRSVAIFCDDDNNGHLDEGEHVARLWRRDPHRVSLRWQGFGPGYARFEASGSAAANGAFTLCPGNGDRRAARQVIINRSGRAYVSRDIDGDGVVEYGADREPTCPPG